MLRSNQKNAIFKALLYTSFFLFLAVLIWGIYFKANNYKAVIKNYNKLADKTLWERFTYDLVPFNQYAITPKKVIEDFFMNALAFLPLGLYLPLMSRKNTLLKGALIAFLITLSLETLQLVTVVGTFSSNDLIANTFGYFVGFLLYKLIGNKVPKTVINVVNILIIIVTIPFLIHVFSDTLSHFSVYAYKKL